jgi:hypothetical protein
VKRNAPVTARRTEGALRPRRAYAPYLPCVSFFAAEISRKGAEAQRMRVSFISRLAADLDLLGVPAELLGDRLGIFPAGVVVLIDHNFRPLSRHRHRLRHVEKALDVEEVRAVAVSLWKVMKLKTADLSVVKIEQARVQSYSCRLAISFQTERSLPLRLNDIANGVDCLNEVDPKNWALA